MFDGVPDQLHQFIAASSRTSIPLPLSFSSATSSSLYNHVSSTNTNIFPSFDPFNTSSHQQVSLQMQPPHFLHSLQQSAAAHKNELKEENINSSCSLVSMNNLEIERERSIAELADPAWSNDELLALLRIRSSWENWFPELTWEHVSRKLEELGYKRSAEKCKEKFEEESRSFNYINYSKNYRTFFSEFGDDEDDEEQLSHGQNAQKVSEENRRMEQRPREEEEQQHKRTEQNLEGGSRNHPAVGNKPSDHHPQDKDKILVEKSSKGKKRKREKNFEMFKCLCEDIVKKLIAQQEEMHSKILEDMLKRDEEKAAREEAWKKQEMDRIDKELENRAYERAIASDRQATIIKFLTKFTPSSPNAIENQSLRGSSEESSVKHKILSCSNPPASSSLIISENPNPTSHQANKQNNEGVLPNSALCQTQNSPLISTSLSKNLEPQNPSSILASKTPTSPAIAQAPQNPNSPNTRNKQLVPTSSPIHNSSQKVTSNDREDIGKRWPRDEVLALINLRCNLYNNGQEKEGATRTPLWERISQGMSKLGYKRSAKRCKEKWENINKYFKKTKDTSKKRSLDSRTCPYFHQLSTLYNQGTLVAPSNGTEISLTLPENYPNLSQNHRGTSQGGNSSTDSTMHVAQQGEKNLVQQVVAAFEFEF